MKIATHNSLTGEKGTFLSTLLTPFAKCQSKTLVEQYNAGCRFFDLRVKKVDGTYYGAHGLWRTKKTLVQLLYNLYEVCNDKVYITLTYEGILEESEKPALIEFCDKVLRVLYPKFIWGPICAKYSDHDLKVDWVLIKQGAFMPKNVQGFLPLNGSTWHTYLPVPWLWKKLYYNKPQFNNVYYTFVDFL